MPDVPDAPTTARARAPLGAPEALPAEALSTAGDVIGALLRAEHVAVRVPALLDPTLCRALVDEAYAGALPEHPFSVRFEAYSRGMILDHCGADLGDYLRAAAELERTVAGSESGSAILACVAGALTALNGGREVEVPVHASGARYAPFTLRRYPTGGLIPPHCEREQLRGPAYRDLGPQLDHATLLSFLVVLEAPEAGGALVLYDLGPDDPGAARALRDRMQVAQKLQGVASVDVELETGDLIVFDGGRWFHQILPVRGPRARWTLGGFLGRAADDGRVLRWS